MEKEYTRKECDKCQKVVEAFHELYEMYGDMCVLDTGRFGFVVLRWYSNTSFDGNTVYTDSRELFDDLWEMWLDYKLLDSVLGTGREEIDYEQLYTELPVETKDEYDSKRKYFLGLSRLND